MSDSEPTPMLIQQRFALRRGRAYAVWMIVVSLILAGILMVSQVIGDRDGWVQWFGLAGVAVWLGVAAYGVARFLAARRANREFDDRYGTDAGTQS